MSLYTKILIAAILPFVIFFILGVFRIQNVINKYDLALHHQYEIKAKGVDEAIRRVVDRIDTAVRVLSESEEISKALQRADNNVLFDISKRFIGSIDTITFSDINGTVIARAPDEFKFGDDIGSEIYFQPTLKNGNYLGCIEIDGIDTIIISRPVKKYNDIDVGLICAGIHITTDLLRSLADDRDVFVEFLFNDKSVLSSAKSGKIVYSKSLKGVIKNSQKPLLDVTVYFEEDKYFSELLTIRESLYWSSIPIVLILIGLLIFILNRQLKPYSMIVDHILNYANNKMSTDELKNCLMNVKHASGGESVKISTALAQMLDVIDKNFDLCN